MKTILVLFTIVFLCGCKTAPTSPSKRKAPPLPPMPPGMKVAKISKAAAPQPRAIFVPAAVVGGPTVTISPTIHEGGVFGDWNLITALQLSNHSASIRMTETLARSPAVDFELAGYSCYTNDQWVVASLQQREHRPIAYVYSINNACDQTAAIAAQQAAISVPLTASERSYRVVKNGRTFRLKPLPQRLDWKERGVKQFLLVPVK